MKLRSQLVVLVVAALVPLLIFAGFMMAFYDRQQRTNVENRVLETTRALSSAIDHEVASWISALEALGTSRHLDSGDLGAFREEAARVLKTREEWTNIVLADSEGRQLLNLLAPPGSPLPHVGDLDQLQQAVRTSRPIASNLFLGPRSHEQLIGVAVPIVRNGKVKFVLASSTSPKSLLQILAEQNIPPDWIGTIIDRKGVVIATSRYFQQKIGKPPMELRDITAGEAEEGLAVGTAEDGNDVRVAFHRSELTGWTVRLAIPVSALEAPLRRSLWLTVGGGLALLLAGIMTAALHGRQIVGSIRALSDAAAALGRSEIPPDNRYAISELNDVGLAIQKAAVQRKRADEANLRHLERLQALREIELAISSSLDVSTTLRLLVEKAGAFLPPDSVTTVRLLNPKSGEFEPVACRNIDEEEWKAKERRTGKGLSSIILETKAPLILENVQTDPRRMSRDFAAAHGLVSYLGMPLLVREEVLGLLSLYTRRSHRFTPDEIEFVSMLASQAAIAIHHSQLYGELALQANRLAAANEQVLKANEQLEDEIAERKRLEREVLEIARTERQRIGQDLHDGLGQELTGIAFLARGLAEKLEGQSNREAAQAKKISHLVNEAIRHTRALARGLSPVPVEANGLMSALEELAVSVRTLFPVRCNFRCAKPVLVADNAAATHLYHIAQEAVDNAVRHGKATEIVIELSAENGTGALTIADNGGGLTATADSGRGLGLRIMRHRAEMIEGRVEIEPVDGGGTVVRCTFRLPKHTEATDHGGVGATRS